MEEIWKDVNFGRLKYQASNHGRFKRVKQKYERIAPFGAVIVSELPERMVNLKISNTGYYIVSIDQKWYSLHRLVASYFIPNSNHLRVCVNHIDGNKLNNHVSNLEWVTKGENNAHAYANNLVKTKKPVKAITADGKEFYFESARDAVRKSIELFGVQVCYKKISNACKLNVLHYNMRWEFTTDKKVA